MENAHPFRPYRRFYESESPLSGKQLDAFLANGWYRMRQTVFTQSHYYGKPSAKDRPVWWLRFPVAAVRERDSHRRLRRRNGRFRIAFMDPFENCGLYEALYGRYFDAIDFDGYPSIGDALFEHPDGKTVFQTCGIALYDGGRLAAMGLFDMGAASCASILHFYDPEYARFSLGRYMVLLTVDLLRERGLQWYYPGYVVPGLPKFDYKLFLGKECAEYYHPWEEAWKPFEEGILDPETNRPNMDSRYETAFYDEEFPPPFL